MTKLNTSETDSADKGFVIKLSSYVFVGFVKVRGELFTSWGKGSPKVYSRRWDAENALAKIALSKGWHEGRTDYMRIEKV